MAFEIDRFIRLRPFLFHVTARENADALADTLTLQPADTLLRWAGRQELSRVRRRESIAVQAGVHRIVLKDQAPLIAANAELAPGWDFADFIEFLNRHVFFWPGTARGPIAHGQRLHSRYESDGPLVLRIPTEDLFAANATELVRFAAFNTGAPRMTGGRRSPRGPDLFQIASEFPRRASEVVEVAYRSSVALPETTEAWTGTQWDALEKGAA